MNASKSLPAGTHLRIRISTKGSAFSGFGKVIYATSGGDIGIVFRHQVLQTIRALHRGIPGRLIGNHTEIKCGTYPICGCPISAIFEWGVESNGL